MHCATDQHSNSAQFWQTVWWTVHRIELIWWLINWAWLCLINPPINPLINELMTFSLSPFQSPYVHLLGFPHKWSDEWVKLNNHDMLRRMLTDRSTTGAFKIAPSALWKKREMSYETFVSACFVEPARYCHFLRQSLFLNQPKFSATSYLTFSPVSSGYISRT